MARSKHEGNKSKKEHDEQKRRQREAMRRLRDARRLDPVRYEEEKRKERERYYKRKEEGKIKTIGQMTEREKRIQRKDWRERSKVYYDRKKDAKELEAFLSGNSPPPSPRPEELEPEPLNRQDDGRKRQGKLRRRNHTRAMREEISKLRTELRKEKKKKEKYRMRLKRIKKEQHKNIDTPRKRLLALTEGQNLSLAVKKKLFASEVIEDQLTDNYRNLKKNTEKRKFWEFISGNIVKKYKQKSYLRKVTSAFISEREKKIRRIRKRNNIRQQIKQFLETDENSRLCPGKYDFIKKNNVRKQKRLLNDTLRNCHRKFMKQHNIQIGYATFCRLRPFWIVQPKINNRDTCLCIMHTNMWLLVRKLKAANVVKENSLVNLCRSICCETSEGGDLEEICLERKCENCRDKTILTKDFDPADTMMYEKWITKRVTVVIKGEEKLCRKTVKEKLVSTKLEVLTALETSIKPFLLHIRNVNHQMKAIKILKAQLNNNEALIHMDFSENYSCKYAEEVQSAHFGGSKMQLSLHTVVVYYRGSNNLLEKKCFCTVSQNLRHDPIAICAHLLPLFKDLNFVGNLKTIHFLSDGPSTQYRNRKMFYLMANFISQELKVEELRWHYSEKGHGKGAPDGVGGVLKRTADAIVARGTDLPDLKSFLHHLQLKCLGVKLFEVGLDDSELQEIEKILPEKLPEYRGIIQSHEVVWAKQNSEILDIRKLTCLDCPTSAKCSHYSLGIYHLLKKPDGPVRSPKRRLRYEDIYYSSSSDEENTPLALLFNKRIMQNDSSSGHNNILEYSVPILSEANTTTLMKKDPSENDYVVVKFISKKLINHYIGVIQSTNLDDYPDEYLIKFLKKKTGTDKFVFPLRDDISLINKTDVVTVLPPPIVSHRGRYIFDADYLSLLKNLN